MNFITKKEVKKEDFQSTSKGYPILVTEAPDELLVDMFNFGEDYYTDCACIEHREQDKDLFAFHLDNEIHWQFFNFDSNCDVEKLGKMRERKAPISVRDNRTIKHVKIKNWPYENLTWKRIIN